MAPNGFSDTFYKGPAFAMVIGVSRYHHGVDEGQPVGPSEVPNLKFASKDAADFAEFLENYGFIPYNVRSLLDEEATRENIMTGFAELRDDCLKSEDENPLVVIYFSGHGMADRYGDHYLIPHDGERDNLAATALLNDEFNSRLRRLKTDRLVVFLDACHSGGMALEGAKGGVLEYNAKELGEGAGRYVIASCLPEQKSWEGEENGIFTQHLLEILRGESPGIDKEEIDIFTLYPELRKKVEQTAQKLHGETQTPEASNFKGATGIVLAINKRVRDRRMALEEENSEARIEFLEAVKDELATTDARQKTVMKFKLQSYVREGMREVGHDDFYNLFDEYFAVGGTSLDEVCKYLIMAYEKATAPAKAPDKTAPEKQASEPDDLVETSGRSSAATKKRSKSASASAAPTGPRRRFATEDCEYILGEIMTKLDYYTQTSRLRSCLVRPVSSEEFLRAVFDVAPESVDDPLQIILTRIVERFKEKWPEAEEVEATTLTVLMTARKGDELNG